MPKRIHKPHIIEQYILLQNRYLSRLYDAIIVSYCFPRVITSYGDYIFLKGILNCFVLWLHVKRVRVHTIWELRGKRLGLEFKIQKGRKPYIITHSNATTWWSQWGLGNAESCSQKYCKSLNLETDCKLDLNGPQTLWPLFIEVFVFLWQYQEPNLFLVKYTSVLIVPAMPG